MPTVTWTMRLYSIGGGEVSAADMTPSASVSNQIKHATNRQVNFPLNGIDSLDFSVYLDDPMAANIVRLRRVVKLWRTVRDVGGSVIYSDGSPCFAGVVAYTNKMGADNIMHVKCQAPLWRLQSRFHLLNHYLKINVDTGEDYLQSELLWKLIDLVNNAFGLDDSNTGITQGSFALTNDPVVAPFFVGKGSNTWVNFDTIMNRPGGIDIVPEYINDGGPSLMSFNTSEKRGSNRGTFNFHTGSGDNLDDLQEENLPVPGEFANYLWAVGEGGPNSGKIAMRENIDEDEDSYESIGIYMRRADFPEVKRIGVVTPKPTHLHALAEAEFAQARVPKTNYNCVLSPVGGTYYGSHFTTGDVVTINGSKGALSVSGVQQRVYNTTLANSDNNLETATVEVADDFTEAFVT